MSRLLRLVLVAALLAGACTQGSEADPTAARSDAPSPSPAPSPSVINPPGVFVANVAFGRSKRRVRTAVRDLKAMGLWRPLTRHLFMVKFGSRLGAVNIPDDGHLADAVLTVAEDARGAGALCDVLFFPNSLAQDLDRWRLYYSHAAIADPPPTLRQLWGAVAAHELGHCLPGGPGERVARRWESKALAKLRELSD